jgi:hypothetical protein
MCHPSRRYLYQGSLGRGYARTADPPSRTWQPPAHHRRHAGHCTAARQQHDLARDQAFRRAAGSVFQHGGSAEYDVIRDLAWLCPILVDAPRSTTEAAQSDVTAGRGQDEKVGLANPWLAACLTR